MKKQNPITIIEESLLSLKNFIDRQVNDNETVITKEDILNIKNQAFQLHSFCEQLNSDVLFVQHINGLRKAKEDKTNLVKTQHYFITDLAILVKKNSDLNPKQLFVLAYYYDALRNEKFADENAIKTLNRLILTPDFKENIFNLLVKSQQEVNQNSVIETLQKLKHSKLEEAKKHFELISKKIFESDVEKVIEIKKELENSKPEEVVNPAISLPPKNDSLEKVMAELDQLIGLEAVKNDIKELINLLEIQKKRKQEGLQNIDLALHTVFLGPPGTGKTTVARLLSRIFKLLGFVSKGQLYETDREGLIAGYVGQTAIKTDNVVDESIGGVLFIDEAYSLTQNALQSDYGAEAVNTILKRMEDNREDLAVVVAGYLEPIQLFIESNPGLRSRFNRYFHFEHFKPLELFKIFESQCKKLDFVLTDDAIDKLKETFELLYEKRDESFGNARVVRNLFEKCVQNQANRVIKVSNITKDVLRALVEEDIPEPKETLEATFYSLNEE